MIGNITHLLSADRSRRFMCVTMVQNKTMRLAPVSPYPNTLLDDVVYVQTLVLR
jgi:hypothetical protein